MYQKADKALAQELMRLARQVDPSMTRPAARERHPSVMSDKEEFLHAYRRRFLALDRGLTSREVDVCARSMLGMTAEGIALELGIKKSSVSTYRKRAYERLSISSKHELFWLVA